jgi:hypothetical protein
VKLAGLSALQQQQIADGYAVFSKLLEPVLQGMRQLQLQQPTAESSTADPESSSGAGASSSRNNCSSNSGLAADGSCSAAVGGAGDSKLPEQAAAAAVSGGAYDLLTADGYKTHRSAAILRLSLRLQLQLYCCCAR